MQATSTFLSKNASTTSAALSFSESTFQVPTQNPQPFCSPSALRSSLTTLHPGTGLCCVSAGFPHLCLRRHVAAPMGWYSNHQMPSLFAIFSIFWSKMKITQADAPAVWIDCHPILTNWCHHGPTSAIPAIFTPHAFPSKTLPIYPVLGQAPNMLARILGGLVSRALSRNRKYKWQCHMLKLELHQLWSWLLWCIVYWLSWCIYRQG